MSAVFAGGDVALFGAVAFAGDEGAYGSALYQLADVEVDGSRLSSYANVLHDFHAAARFSAKVDDGLLFLAYA